MPSAYERDALIAAVLGGYRRRSGSGYGGGGGAPPVPGIAFQFNATTNLYDLYTENVDAPDAYFVDVSGDIQLQAGATSGLTMVQVGSDIIVQTP